MYTFRKLDANDESQVSFFLKRLKKEPLLETSEFTNSENFFALLLLEKEAGQDFIVGLATVSFTKSYSAGKVAIIGDFIFEEKPKKRGFERPMLCWIIDEAKEREALCITSIPNNEDLKDLFLDLGFIEKDTEFFVKDLN